MHKDIYYCDRCGKQLPEEYNPLEDQVRIPVDKISCPAGGHGDIVYDKKDMCLHCLAVAVSRWFDNYVNDWGSSREFVKVMTKGSA